VLQNEKQPGWGHQLTSGSRPHWAQANQLQPNETNFNHSSQNIQHHQNITEQKTLQTQTSKQPFQITPSTSRFSVFLQKSLNLSFHFSYFVFQEPPQLSLHFSILSSKNLAS
jgi:hypothetical protein